MGLKITFEAMLKNLAGKRIILASGSPRRKELLSAMGLAFEVVSTNVDETFDENLIGWEIPMYLSEKKAHSLKGNLGANDIVISADTIVWTNKGVLNKPADKEDAKRMLEALSGKTHTVYTAVTLMSLAVMKTFYDTTEVTFGILSAEEIDYYIEACKPFDKAGSYGAQDWIGVTKIESLRGSYFNVMGLPTHKLYAELQQIG